MKINENMKASDSRKIQVGTYLIHEIICKPI